MIEAERRYSVKDAAWIMAVSRRTIERAIALGYETRGKKGLYPVEKIGVRTLIRASTLDEWARRFTVEAS